MKFETARSAFDFYCTAINEHCFDALETNVFHPDIVCRFDADIFKGLASVRSAFESAWARIPDEIYRMTDHNWLLECEALAVVAFRYSYSGHSQSGQVEMGGGTGINCFTLTAEGWRLIFEDLRVRNAKTDGETEAARTAQNAV